MSEPYSAAIAHGVNVPSTRGCTDAGSTTRNCAPYGLTGSPVGDSASKISTRRRNICPSAGGGVVVGSRNGPSWGRVVDRSSAYPTRRPVVQSGSGGSGGPVRAGASNQYSPTYGSDAGGTSH